MKYVLTVNMFYSSGLLKFGYMFIEFGIGSG